MSEEIKIPRKLVVRKDAFHAALYRACIGIHAVGIIVKGEDKDGTLFSFEPDPAFLPKTVGKFTTRTMKALREELVRRIPRDLYMAILEKDPPNVVTLGALD